MKYEKQLKENTVKAIKDLYDAEVSENQVTINDTPSNFDGDFTIVTFPFAKAARKAPMQIAEELGQYLTEKMDSVRSFNVVKGFLNLTVQDQVWTSSLQDILYKENYEHGSPLAEKVMVEFASPNTNKPLHLGHVRNILLGWSISKILKAAGKRVTTTQIVNDRGIAITKSMLAWKKYGNGATPESTGKKGDHFVGDYYVLFAQKLAEEYANWIDTDAAEKEYKARKKADQSKQDFFKAYKDTYFNKYSALGAEAREMLQKWEKHDPETLELWRTMNSWVLAGFETTFETLGISIDKTYLESDTYLLGKDIVQDGLQKGVFYKNDDGSIAVDLEDKNLGEKIVMRSDGTSLYVTQDIGLARQRHQEFGMDSMVYVVGNEQIYHFDALFAILEKLQEPYAKKLYHLAYGMVNLTTGKMKSREGTVVDADDLMADMVTTATKESLERNEITDLSPDKQAEIRKNIALGALKYFILKVNPKKRMVFDPAESIELQGQTGPYIQYAYVRTAGLKKYFAEADTSRAALYTTLEKEEKDLIKWLTKYPALIQEAAKEYDPSIIAAFAYNLAKAFSKFWHERSILKAEEPGAKEFRFLLSQAVGDTLKDAMDLLGIKMPTRM
ncbi:MAG TPA: arginine--tRNA ligase [Saprospiraceae bacterium]|nr:arginine--tRNA ligase [Saprospiraceae bacterium]